MKYITLLNYQIATVIGLCETKLDNAVLSSELEVEGF